VRVPMVEFFDLLGTAAFADPISKSFLVILPIKGGTACK
jgi:hypothetical protein